MLIDCDTCAAPANACHGCVMTVLLRQPSSVELDETERDAIATLAGAGLVPPLRLVRAVDHGVPGEDGPVRGAFRGIA